MFERLEDRIVELARERQAEDSTVAEAADAVKLFQAKELPPRTGAEMAQVLMEQVASAGVENKLVFPSFASLTSAAGQQNSHLLPPRRMQYRAIVQARHA